MASTNNDTNSTKIIPSMTSVDYGLLANRIGTLIYSIIYLLGFVGNTLALITFSSRRMCQISSSIFLLALSISDSLALVTSLWHFLADAFQIYLQNYSALACRCRMFFAYVFMDLSSWCIAGLAFDRYLRTRLPLGSKTLCTPRNASITILIFFFALCGINGHYFSPGIGQERGGNRTQAHCLENRLEYPRYYYFYKIIWPKIDMAIFCFLPACIMILCNVNIIYLVKRQRHTLEHTNNDSQDIIKTPVPIYQTLSGSSSIKKPPANTHRKALERQMSLMMAACVIVFLCTTVPVTICLLLLERTIMKNPYFGRDNALFIFIFRIVRTLMNIHFGCNFYLYCLTSRIFRAEFMIALRCRRTISLSNPEQSTSMMLHKIDDI
ncbi:unnamed protein product [Adineta steineri]|uniref:G-protein coupled receptors family 1 profile domain-containing protein n=1 Tax=Adineta steineri TaxID=433720 RepID=A0A814KBY2_9BILA|nr:unnamed protein product [Adineta steineri]CAF1047378.1 unnamed protein product [Adineta steineri]